MLKMVYYCNPIGQNIYISMKTFDNENILDYISTKRGRSYKNPTFGDNLNCRNMFGKKEKEKVKINRVEEVHPFHAIKEMGYKQTYIHRENNSIVVLNRLLHPNIAKKQYPTAYKVVYKDKNNWSEVFYFSIKGKYVEAPKVKGEYKQKISNPLNTLGEMFKEKFNNI